MKYWLMKSEPDECSIDDVLAAPKRTLARAQLPGAQLHADDMSIGDGVLFYHSSCPEPGIAGLAEVASAPTDETQFDPKRLLRSGLERDKPRWFNVDVRAQEDAPHPPRGKCGRTSA